VSFASQFGPQMRFHLVCLVLNCGFRLVPENSPKDVFEVWIHLVTVITSPHTFRDQHEYLLQKLKLLIFPKSLTQIQTSVL
jgi:hypothetical protein